MDRLTYILIVAVVTITLSVLAGWLVIHLDERRECSAVPKPAASEIYRVTVTLSTGHIYHEFIVNKKRKEGSE